MSRSSETTPGLSLRAIHQRLQQHFGELHWWPADSPFEVVTGAILTQNTAWSNVEKAIDNLRCADTLDCQSLAQVSRPRLEELIRPAGYFRQKAERLQLLAQLLWTHHQGDVAAWCSGPLEQTRTRLLQQKGIGPETADSILLYAAGRPSFVVDAYTRRILSRVGLLQGTEPYDQIRQQFMSELPHEAALFNAYHAEIVQLAKNHCRKQRPSCGDCPLRADCAYGQQHLARS